MPVPHLRLGTRGSQLALWQANAVAERIVAAGGPSCELVVIKTGGDHLQNVQLSEAGGKRLFVKELEDALLGGDIDLAVHSSKDMPVVLPGGLAIAGVLPREDPRDAIVLPIRLKPDPTVLPIRLKPDPTNDAATNDAAECLELEDIVERLGAGAKIGTGSVRRVAQLAQRFRRSQFVAVRGNLDTRLRKLDEGQYDALVLASAGLRRLGFGSRISLALPPLACVPAPGQGIVAVEIRAGDDEVRRAIAAIDDPATHAALIAERAMVTTLGGGCQTPIGALAVHLDAETLELTGIVAATDGARSIRVSARATVREAKELGSRVGSQLLAQGASELLAGRSGQQSFGTAER